MKNKIEELKKQVIAVDIDISILKQRKMNLCNNGEHEKSALLTEALSEKTEHRNTINNFILFLTGELNYGS